MIKPKLILACAVILLISGIGFAAFAIDHPNSSSAVVQNADIALNERVETLLRTDVGLAGSRFRIQTRGGVVILGGGVPDEHALNRALDLASSVRGVREVRNELEIEFPK